MAEHSEVFISATTRDLASYRREIKDTLLSLQIFPIEEISFTRAYGPLKEMLRALIGRCDAVIHLAGFYYGAEPSQRPSGEPRRSYTQIEYDVARELGRPIYLFLATEEFDNTETPTQTDEEKNLQFAHRQAIQTCGDLYYWFASTEQVANRVKELRFPARGAAAPRRVVNLPYNSLGPLFKGRDSALVELRQRLMGSGGRAVGLTARQAIYGLGGVGKTRLAVEYAWRQASDYENALLFVSARSLADFQSNLAVLCNAEILNLPERDKPEEKERLAAVFLWLNEHSGWLLILDNADTPETVAEAEKTLSKLQGGGVIVTSRLANWSPAFQPVELNVLAEKDAAAFLLERTEQKRQKTNTDTGDAAVLARELGGLALALEQAGAYIVKNRLSFSKYRQRWGATREIVLGWYDPRLMNYPSGVATTWQASVDQLAKPERKLLNILAWFAPEPIPVSLLEGVPADGMDGCDALSGLVSWSLARWNAGGNAFTIHRLVQEITRQRLSDSEKEGAKGLIRRLLNFLRLRVSGNEKNSSLELALQILNIKLHSPDWDQAGWQLWEQLAPHYRTLLGHLRNHPLEAKATRVMNDLASWLENRAEYDEAELLYRQALAILEKALGPEHPNVATILNNLAGLYHAQGRYGQAEPLYQRALAIRKKVPGPDHPDVATGLNNLAELYRVQGRYTQAELLLRRAFAILERALGSEHPLVATSLNNLATLYYNQGRYAEAHPLYQRTLAIREKALGPEHPDVAESLNNLGQLYDSQGRHAEAEPLYERALAILEKALGPEYPLVATSLNNLANLFQATNRLSDAEPLMRRALQIYEKCYGHDHPDVATILNNLATLLQATNRLSDAEPLFRRALAIREKALGPEHPNVATCLENYAVLLLNMDRLEEAGRLEARAMAIRAKKRRN